MLEIRAFFGLVLVLIGLALVYFLGFNPGGKYNSINDVRARLAELFLGTPQETKPPGGGGNPPPPASGGGGGGGGGQAW